MPRGRPEPRWWPICRHLRESNPKVWTHLALAAYFTEQLNHKIGVSQIQRCLRPEKYRKISRNYYYSKNQRRQRDRYKTIQAITTLRQAMDFIYQEENKNGL